MWELEPKKEEQSTEPSIVVYDLPPGAAPVLHRTAKEAEAPVSNADAPSAQHPTSSSYHMFEYDPPDGERVDIGMWSPPDRGQSEFGGEFVVHGTDKAETAERWRAELSAGRLPEGSENVPQGREAPG